MPPLIKKEIRNFARYVLKILFPKLYFIEKNEFNVNILSKNISNTIFTDKTTISTPASIGNCYIGDYTYISFNSRINMTTIGKFCSIGPNFFCGWGIHPTDGLSTSPAFYSTSNVAGISFSNVDKIIERKPIAIGNDVFIGMNVTILDGIKIGDGAVIGAGSVVSKDIPPYAIAIGTPIQILRYRFNEDTINSLLAIKWWDFDKEGLKDVEKYFYNIDEFIKKHQNH